MSNGSFPLLNRYAGRSVLITGGLGFLGSNLALTLHRAGAHVRVIDSLVEGCGGSVANLGTHASDMRIEVASIADRSRVEPLLDGVDTVFNLAAEISHSADAQSATRDLALNAQSQLAFLGCCADRRPGVRVVYTSTRQVYGVPLYLPVDERHPVNPVDFNGVHKQAATQYHLLLTRMRKLDGVVLNLTNIYGPRIALNVPGQGFLAHYVTKALRGERLTVFGDGSQVRDPLFVDDSVEAILMAGVAPLSEHRVFNIGHPEVWSLREIAGLLSTVANLPEPEFQPFPESRRIIDIGSYSTDTRLAHSVLGWQAATRLGSGIEKTLRHYGWGQSGKAATASANRPSPLCQSA